MLRDSAGGAVAANARECAEGKNAAGPGHVEAGEPRGSEGGRRSSVSAAAASAAASVVALSDSVGMGGSVGRRRGGVMPRGWKQYILGQGGKNSKSEGDLIAGRSPNLLASSSTQVTTTQVQRLEAVVPRGSRSLSLTSTGRMSHEEFGDARSGVKATIGRDVALPVIAATMPAPVDPPAAPDAKQRWRDALSSVRAIALPAARTPHRCHRVNPRVDHELLNDPTVVQLAPLLSPVLRVPIRDNYYTEQLEAEARHTETIRVMVRLLELKLQGRRTLLLLEDVHWMDALSWQLLEQLRQKLLPLGIVMTSRPQATRTSEVDAAIPKLVLEAMGQAELHKLVRHGESDIILHRRSHSILPMQSQRARDHSRAWDAQPQHCQSDKTFS